MTPIPAYPTVTEARIKASAERIRNGPDHHDHFPRGETPARNTVDIRGPASPPSSPSC